MGISVDEKLKIATHELKGFWCYDGDNKFKYLYPFTTENIAAYMPYLDMANKKALMLGSSGDQALNAMLFGCKDIKILDMCPFTEDYYNLKKAAIEVLTRDEFLDFFSYNSAGVNLNMREIFNKNTYARIHEVLKSNNLEAAYFWNYLFNKYRSLKIRKRLFQLDLCAVNQKTTFNAYLKDAEHFNELKKRINNSNVTFENANIFNAKINGSFDIINISNILDYYGYESIYHLIQRLSKSLTENGKIALYLYATEKDKLSTGMENYEDIDKLLTKLDGSVDAHTFPSTYEYLGKKIPTNDTIITYKKIKKI